MPTMRLLVALITIAVLPAAYAGIELSHEVLSRLQHPGTNQTVVIHSGPNAQSAAPFLQPLLPEADDPVDDAGAVQSGSREPIPFPMRSLFPVQSPAMRLGYYTEAPYVDPKQRPAEPLCLLGTDSFSREWLTANHLALKEQGARCICIDATTQESWESLKAIAPDLQILPASLDFSSIGLDRYPMLLLPSGVVEQ